MAGEVFFRPRPQASRGVSSPPPSEKRPGRHPAPAGAGTITPVKESAVNVENFKRTASAASSTESPYLNRLKEVEE